VKALLVCLDLRVPVGLREPTELLDQRETGAPLDLLDPLDLLESCLSFLLISCSKEMLLPHQDQRGRPEEMPSVSVPDLRRTAMLI